MNRKLDERSVIRHFGYYGKGGMRYHFSTLRDIMLDNAFADPTYGIRVMAISQKTYNKSSSGQFKALCVFKSVNLT